MEKLDKQMISRGLSNECCVTMMKNQNEMLASGKKVAVLIGFRLVAETQFFAILYDRNVKKKDKNCFFFSVHQY